MPFSSVPPAGGGSKSQCLATFENMTFLRAKIRGNLIAYGKCAKLLNLKLFFLNLTSDSDQIRFQNVWMQHYCWSTAQTCDWKTWAFSLNSTPRAKLINVSLRQIREILKFLCEIWVPKLFEVCVTVEAFTWFQCPQRPQLHLWFPTKLFLSCCLLLELKCKVNLRSPVLFSERDRISRLWFNILGIKECFWNPFSFKKFCPKWRKYQSQNPKLFLFFKIKETMKKTLGKISIRTKDTWSYCCASFGNPTAKVIGCGLLTVVLINRSAALK